jgi:hypothetical protein
MRWEGQLALVSTITYGLIRIAEGFVRADSNVLLSLDGSQLAASVASSAPSACISTVDAKPPRSEHRR